MIAKTDQAFPLRFCNIVYSANNQKLGKPGNINEATQSHNLPPCCDFETELKSTKSFTHAATIHSIRFITWKRSSTGANCKTKTILLHNNYTYNVASYGWYACIHDML